MGNQRRRKGRKARRKKSVECHVFLWSFFLSLCPVPPFLPSSLPLLLLVVVSLLLLLMVHRRLPLLLFFLCPTTPSSIALLHAGSPVALTSFHRCCCCCCCCCCRRRPRAWSSPSAPLTLARPLPPPHFPSPRPLLLPPYISSASRTSRSSSLKLMINGRRRGVWRGGG